MEFRVEIPKTLVGKPLRRQLVEEEKQRLALKEAQAAEARLAKGAPEARSALAAQAPDDHHRDGDRDIKDGDCAA